jgi:hypothetical protein
MECRQLNLSARVRGKSCIARKLWNNLIAPLLLLLRIFPFVWTILWQGWASARKKTVIRRARGVKWIPLKAASSAWTRIKLHSKQEAQEERHAELVCSTGDGRASGFAAVRSGEKQRSQSRFQWRGGRRGVGRGSE